MNNGSKAKPMLTKRAQVRAAATRDGLRVPVIFPAHWTDEDVRRWMNTPAGIWVA